MAASDAFYQEIAEEVAEVLQELGTTYSVQTPGAYDQQTMSTSAASQRDVIGLVADQKTAIGFMDSEGTAKWAWTKSLLLDASANLQPNESVIVDGVTYPVNDMVAVKPAEVIVLYIVGLVR